MPLRFGMKAEVTFRISAPDAVTVPLRAVHYEGGEALVWVVEGEGSGAPVRRRVVLGPASGGRVQVLDGLSGTERLRVME